MTLIIKAGTLLSRILIPGSKSYANRILILASLKKSPFTIKHLPQATDVTHLIDALKIIGLKFSTDDDGVTILNSFPDCETRGANISVGEGGTTARFLACLLLRGHQPYRLKLGPGLKQRPWQEFLNFVNAHGAKAQLIDDELFLQGPLSLPAQIEIDCSRTTQFASGLQMAFASTPLQVIPVQIKSSQSYWEMTQEMIELIQKHDEYTIPLDWSSASYPLAFGALAHPITFPGLSYDPHQADAKFLDILNKFECIEVTSNGISVHPTQRVLSLSYNVADCLDLVPALAFFLAHIKGIHHLTGVGNLIYKESDRLSHIMSLLGQFERKCHLQGDSLMIHGDPGRLADYKQVTMPDDHRMVMAASLFLLYHGGGSLSPADAVNKSFPSFFQNLKVKL